MKHAMPINLIAFMMEWIIVQIGIAQHILELKSIVQLSLQQELAISFLNVGKLLILQMLRHLVKLNIAYMLYL